MCGGGMGGRSFREEFRLKALEFEKGSQSKGKTYNDCTEIDAYINKPNI